MAEEAVECAQALGVPKETMLRLIEVVYSRPLGSPLHELGGVLNTACVICHARGYDPVDVLATEIERCLMMPPEKFSKRNDEKVALGLTA